MTLITTAFAQGTHAARPAAATGNTGYYYFETDTGTLFQSTGSAWTQLAAPTSGGGGGGAWTQLAVTTLASPAANIAFSSISGSYRKLVLEYALMEAGANQEENGKLTVNGDTGSNYDYATAFLQAGGTADSASQANAAAFLLIGNIPGTSAPAGATLSGRIELPDYASTARRKNVIGEAVQDYSTSVAPYMRRWDLGGHWRSTAAITSLTLASATSNLAAGSWAALYGLT